MRRTTKRFARASVTRVTGKSHRLGKSLGALIAGGRKTVRSSNLEYSMGNVLQFAAHDLAHLRRLDGRGAVFADQFRPDAVPVVRSKVPAADNSVGGLLNGGRVLRAGPPIGVPVLPLANLSVTLDASANTQVSDGDARLGEVLVQGHGGAHSVAPATASSSSNCSGSVRYSLDMPTEALQAHRRARLEAAAEKVGSKAELGRLLGYKDGSLVGQMLRAERPVTEDTVAKLESKHGWKGWFDQGKAPASATSNEHTEIVDAVMTVMSVAERDELLEKYRAWQAKRLRKQG